MSLFSNICSYKSTPFYNDMPFVIGNNSIGEIGVTINEVPSPITIPVITHSDSYRRDDIRAVAI